MGDQKVILVPFLKLEEAHYFCSCINSLPAFGVIKNYIELDASPHVLEYVAIPKFDKRNPVHNRLSDLSLACHAASVKVDRGELAELETHVDTAAAELWGISEAELSGLQDVLGKPQEIRITEATADSEIDDT